MREDTVRTLKRALITIASLVAIGAYAARKTIIAKWLDLPPAHYNVGVERGLDVPMDDGVLLKADHYYPDALGAYPTILMRTPYGRGYSALPNGLFAVFLATRVAERGYHVIVQDTRGRYESEGEFDPFVDEERDGLATIRWIGRQSWFNGKLGLWGPSYLGFVQWAVAAGGPEYLKAIVPIIAASRPAAYYPGGAFILDTSLRWVATISSADGSGARSLLEYLDRMLNGERRLEAAFEHLPLVDADTQATRVGEPATFYRDWLRHPPSDRDYWDPKDYSDTVTDVAVPTHVVAGWYDFFLRAQLADYVALVDAGRQPFLTIGPWTHLDRGVLSAGMREGLVWFDAKLKYDRSRLRDKPVRLYLMGANVWREYDRWPTPATETRYYLHEGGRLDRSKPVAGSSPDRYRYDPSDPTPAVGGPMYNDGAGPVDNRELEARDDVLTYTTPPLDRDIDVIGPVRLELYVESSREHTDFFGRLCDVRPGGRSINVCDGILRLDPDTGEQLPDGSRRIVIDMWATAQRFKRGHRIRLQVSSGAHPRYNRNLGTGEPIATGVRMVPAEQVVYHDAGRPAALVLPVV